MFAVFVFVDDILASVSDESVHLEFSRLLREEFGQKRVTECPTTWLLGMKVDHDRVAKTVKISQEAYSKKLLQAFVVFENHSKNLYYELQIQFC